MIDILKEIYKDRPTVIALLNVIERAETKAGKRKLIKLSTGIPEHIKAHITRDLDLKVKTRKTTRSSYDEMRAIDRYNNELNKAREKL